ncbi:MAG: hypothetical protein LBE10_06710 [Treponema sp.]|jgi:membrane protein implicated in regulation of membrane protease activity|nr:hypothetical protein [Treponema sp.]
MYHEFYGVSFGPWFWLAAAVILTPIEIFTTGLTAIRFTISAVVMILTGANLVHEKCQAFFARNR